MLEINAQRYDKDQLEEDIVKCLTSSGNQHASKFVVMSMMKTRTICKNKMGKIK